MIRLAKPQDVEQIMDIINVIKKEMKKENNPQWNDSYPLENDFMNDIKQNALYIIEENNKIKAFASITEDLEDDYEHVNNRTKERSLVIHRLAVAQNDQKKGYAQKLFSFAMKKALQNNIFYIKADTEIHNIKMNNLFQKLGFQKMVELRWSDNDEIYNYYEKKLGSD